jgi:hypothetical protein
MQLNNRPGGSGHISIMDSSKLVEAAGGVLLQEPTPPTGETQARVLVACLPGLLMRHPRVEAYAIVDAATDLLLNLSKMSRSSDILKESCFFA